MAVFHFFAEPVNFYDCHHFLSFSQFLLCCSGFRTCRASARFVVDKWTIMYTVVMTLLVLTGMSYSFYTIFMDPRQKTHIKVLDNMIISIAFMEIFGSTCTFIIIVASALWFSQRHVALLESISLIDQRLMLEFGANMNYRKIMRKNIAVTLWLGFSYSATVFWAITSLPSGDLLLVCVGGWSYVILTSGAHLCGYVHINWAEMLKIRFRLLQRLLNRDYLLRQFPDEVLRERRMHSAVEMVKTLHMMIREISAIFMFCLLTMLMHDLTLTTSELYLSFEHSSFVRPSLILFVFFSVWVSGQAYKLIMGPIYSQQCVTEGAKCLHIIEQMDVWFPKSKLVRHLVTSTMYWRLAQKFDFEAGVNITFNKTVITMVISLVTSYLMVLVQFGMTTKMKTVFDFKTQVFNEWIGVMGDSAGKNITYTKLI